MQNMSHRHHRLESIIDRKIYMYMIKMQRFSKIILGIKGLSSFFYCFKSSVRFVMFEVKGEHNSADLI